ncbi:MAG: hypothetical protein K6A98_01900, partial [Prevotella sp.]|nr:hypothetical protein [Prevotella sp.]
MGAFGVPSVERFSFSEADLVIISEFRKNFGGYFQTLYLCTVKQKKNKLLTNKKRKDKVMSKNNYKFET